MFRIHLAKRKLFLKKTNDLILLRFVLSLGTAAVASIWSTFLSQTFNLTDSQVGLLISFFYIVCFITALYAPQILELFDESKVLVFGLIAYVIIYLLIPFITNFLVFIGLVILYYIAGVLRIDSFDILFRDESLSKDLSSNEGLLYSLMNLGWLLGPLVGGYFLLRNGFVGVFFMSSFFMFVSVIILLSIKIKPVVKKRDKIDKSILLNFKDYFSTKKLVKPFFMSAGVYLWWSCIFIYVPLFIVKSNLGADFLGLFFALVFIPPVLLEFLIGKLSKKYSFKFFFVIGYVILTILSFLIFFFNDIYITLLLVIIGSFALSLIEPLQDTYFFKNVKKINEEKFYPIYATAEFFGFFTGSLFIALFLFFLSDRFAFFILGCFMIFFTLMALRIKK